MDLIASKGDNDFAKRVASELHTDLVDSETKRFADGEIHLNISKSVRGNVEYIIYSKGDNVNEEIMEVFLMANALKNASAKKIVLVMPYYPYCRQDRKCKSRDPISAKLVADLYKTAGIDHIITMDLHNPSIQGFFTVMDNLSVKPLFIKYIKEEIMKKRGIEKDKLMIISPDVGGAKRAEKMATELGLPMAIIYKKRRETGDDAGKVDSMTLREDVCGLTCIIVDDIADTCGTLAKASDVLKENGASEVITMVTHGLLSGSAVDIINKSSISKFVCTNSVKVSHKASVCSKMEIIDISELIGAAIQRNFGNQSTSRLFEPDFYHKPLSLMDYSG